MISTIITVAFFILMVAGLGVLYGLIQELFGSPGRTMHPDYRQGYRIEEAERKIRLYSGRLWG